VSDIEQKSILANCYSATSRNRSAKMSTANNAYEFPWEEHYVQAVLEPDSPRLQDLITRAHEAIQARKRELNGRPGHTLEMQLAQDALNSLGVLKRERESRAA